LGASCRPRRARRSWRARRPVTEVGLSPLRLDRMSDARVVNNPYPHVVVENALDHLDPLNADFPPREQFGPTIRMDGDLTSGDPAYENLIRNRRPKARCTSKFTRPNS
jgi:hypothetical protein